MPVRRRLISGSELDTHPFAQDVGDELYSDGQVVPREPARNGNHSPTLVEIGYLRQKQGDSVTAEEYYRRAIDADPNNSYAYYRLVELLYREGDIQQAFDMANAALATNPLNDRNKELV